MGAVNTTVPAATLANKESCSTICVYAEAIISNLTLLPQPVLLSIIRHVSLDMYMLKRKGNAMPIVETEGLSQVRNNVTMEMLKMEMAAAKFVKLNHNIHAFIILSNFLRVYVTITNL